MKRVLTILPLTALCISTMQAQHKNEYTNFADTTFNIQEVVATAARKPRPQITKLDVPMKYLPTFGNKQLLSRTRSILYRVY